MDKEIKLGFSLHLDASSFSPTGYLLKPNMISISILWCCYHRICQLLYSKVARLNIEHCGTEFNVVMGQVEILLLW